MGKREVVLVATGNTEISRELTPLVQERLPDITRIIALRGSEAVEEFTELGMRPIDVSSSHGIELLVDAVFNAIDIERKRSLHERTLEEVALEAA